jgi:hypothetical protein
MTSKESQIVIALNDGVTEGVVDDVAGGVVTVSENTRLTKLFGTVSRRPAENLVFATAGGAVSGGIVPGGNEASAIYLKPAVGTRRVVNTPLGTNTVAAQPLVSAVTGGTGQNSYFPYPVIDCGVMGGAQLGCTPATCFDAEGRQWFASIRVVSSTNDLGLYISAVYKGSDVVAIQKLVDITTNPAITFGLGRAIWCGIVPRTGGVTVFYATDTDIQAVSLAVQPDGITPVATASSTLYFPQRPGLFIFADVISDGADAAYLICRDVVTPTDLQVLRFSLSTLSFNYQYPIVGLVSGSGNFLHLALCRRVSGGLNCIGWNVSSDTGGNWFGVLRDTGSGFSSLWAENGGARYGSVAVQPWVENGTDSLVFASTSKGTTATLTTTPTRVLFKRRITTTGGGAGGASGQLSWYALQGRGAAHTVSASEVYPFFPAFACWAAESSEAYPTAPGGVPTDYVVDPSVEVFTPYNQIIGGSMVLTPVGRFGVDRVSKNVDHFQNNSNAAAVSADGRISFVYIEDRPDLSRSAQVGFVARSVEWDLNPSSQPGTAFDSGTVGIVAAALPVAWDGLETTEISIFHRPRVFVVSSGGTGPALTGTYFVTAVISFRDAGGNVRRSPPAEPFPITLAATSPRVYVTIPATFRNGKFQEEYAVTLYFTLAGGSDFYATYTPGVTDRTAAINSMWRFDYIGQPVIRDVRLYSTGATGELLLPDSPPSARHIAAVGGRLWIIPGEDPYSVLPSLLKSYGVAYEFNVTRMINAFDPQYGKLLAIADLNGSPIIFAERGIWAVKGYGPDNKDAGPRFADPQLVSNQGLRNRESICQIPGIGVLFQAFDGKFVLLPSGKRFEDLDTYDVRTPTVHLAENEVIYPLQNGSGFIVYNWVADAWTHWPYGSGTLSYSATSTTQLEGKSRTLLYSETFGSAFLMDSDTVDINDNQHLKITRGWIVPESPQGDCVFREVWVQSLYKGGHGLVVTCEFDYVTSIESVSKSWTSVELGQLQVEGKYTVGVGLHAVPARAIRVTLEALPDEDVGECFQPLTVTITYGANPGPRRRTLKQGALK